MSDESLASGIQGGRSSDASPALQVVPLKFVAAAFGFSWAFWMIPVALGQGWIAWPWAVAAKMPLILVGSLGPLISAFALHFARGGKQAMVEFGARALRFRIPAGILFLSLLLFPAMAALAIYLHQLNGGPRLVLLLSPARILPMILLMFFVGGAFQEEFGWAYAIDHLQRRLNPLPASMLLGVIWAFWHLPLFFIPGLTQTYIPFWSFLLTTVCFRMVFVWAYDNSNFSILVPLLFHTSVNTTLNLFPLIDHHDGVAQTGWLYFCALACIATLPVIRPLWLGGLRLHRGAS